MSDELLKILQTDFPLTSRPWDAIAERLCLAGIDVRNQVAQLRKDGIIRRIAGIFNAQSLGYETTLIAVAARTENIEALATSISQCPNVSHCYQRSDADFPIWFTLAVKGKSIAAAAAELLDDISCDGYMILPCEKRFKLGVIIDPASGSIVPSQPLDSVKAVKNLSESQLAVAEALQCDLPDCDEPFAALADKCGMSAEDFLSAADDLLQLGVMRRYGAILRHNRVGLECNVMAVWQVEPGDSRLAEVAALDSISHCYLRPTQPGWDYNFYTMIHGKTCDHCLASIAEISRVLGDPPRKLLWTVKEFKKSHVIYK